MPTVLGLLGYEKHIHHYGNRLDEIFVLSEDPSEQNERTSYATSFIRRRPGSPVS